MDTLRGRLYRVMGSNLMVDWNTIVLGLERAKWTTQDIADKIGVAKTTVLNWKNFPFNEPRHHHGEALIAIWMQETGRKRDDLPMKRSGI